MVDKTSSNLVDVKIDSGPDTARLEIKKITMQEKINMSCNSTTGYMILINNVIVT
jgi:hypothetical protein